MKNNWAYPNTVWFGNGRIDKLPKACNILNIKKPLLVTDKDLAKTKMVKETLEINKRAKLPIAIFSDLKGNPLGSQVKKGVEVFKNGNHDGIIAFDMIGVFARSLSVTNKGFFIFNILQALGNLLILPLPNQTVLG